jgi:hypothetical protein
MQPPPIEIVKTQVSVTHRTLDPRWRVAYPRHPVPDHVNLKEFPHIWIIPRCVAYEHAHEWCVDHVGDLDHLWTWTDTTAIFFKDPHMPTLLSLTF